MGKKYIQLDMFQSLIGRKIKIPNGEGIVVMVEGFSIFAYTIFEKAKETPWSHRKYVYSVCYDINEVQFIN